MQLGQAQIVRQEWFDRSPSAAGSTVHASVAPHSLTLRDTYTVPANINFRCGSISLSLYRTTAPSASGLVQIIIYLYDDLDAIQHTWYLYLSDANVGGKNSLAIPTDFILPPGWYFNVYTADASTGGIVGHDVSIVGTEFDA